MNLVIFAIGLLVYGVAMHQDLYYRRIPNTVSILIIVMGLGKWLVIGDFDGGMHAFFSALVVFVVLLVIFRYGGLGGGDVKLMTATVFLVGAADFFTWIVLMSLLGGVLAIIIVLRQLAVRVRSSAARSAESLARQTATRPTVPYGIAISLSALWVLFVQTGIHS